MAWTLLTVVAWVTSVSAVRYADYIGAKMPQYGSNEYEIVRDPGQVAVVAEDYHGHSPDASSSLDYKYEDDRIGKSDKPIEESDDGVNWHKPARKHRKFLRPQYENNLQIIDKYVPETESATKFKTNRRFLKHRSRLKRRNFHEDKDTSSQWSLKNARAKKYNSDINQNDFKVDENEITDDTWGELDTDHEQYRQREITERVVRRKPRDKFFNRIPSNVGTSNDDKQLHRKMKSQKDMKLDYMPEDADRDQQRESYKPISDEEEDQEPRGPERQKLKTYEDYGDYYDMKRVHNIKSKLPKLIRRPTVTETTAAPTSAAERELEALLSLHRQRKDVSETRQEPASSTAPRPPTFHPQAIASALDSQWNDFIQTSGCSAQRLSAYVTFLASINYLQRYSDILM